MTRTTTSTGAMARLGFGDPTAVAEQLASWSSLSTVTEAEALVVVEEIARSADRDLAFTGLRRLVAERPLIVRELAADEAWRRRTCLVLGASTAFNQALSVRPGALDELRGEISRRSPDALREELLAAVDAAAEPPDALRWAYRRALLRIAARDLTAPDALVELPSVAGELADLADATVAAALAIARLEVADHALVRFAVIALGKTGAQELNYVSDVDVLYVVEPTEGPDGEPLCTPSEAVAIGTRLAGALTRACSAHTAAGTIWQIDAALRPEGKAGALVRTMASMRSYYRDWAKNWEFQAMLKARPMTGDMALGQEFVDFITPMVWSVAEHPQFVPEVQAMRKRVISLIPAKEQGLEIKLGAGGLRDTEFTVQLLQLVHGRTDERLRTRGTYDGLAALVEHGYVGREDGAQLESAYSFQRLLEHRLQLWQLRRTHLLPTDPVALARLARSVGQPSPEALVEAWRSSTRRVLRLHERMFYSPILAAVARVSSDEARLTSEAAEARLAALGYGDPRAALRHIEALSHGVSRQAEIQRQLLPAMLGWFTEGPNPDHGLLAFRQVSEALGTTPFYLRALRDEGAMAEHLARILASSRYAVDLLLRAPQTVQLLSDDSQLVPRLASEIAAEMRQTAARHDDAERAVDAIRAVRRKELLRLAMGDILGRITLDQLGVALAEVMSATLDATLTVVSRDVADPPAVAVVAMGRWGGRELSYASDADALFVMGDSDDPEALRKATLMVSRMRAQLARPGTDPSLGVDADLRPEGKKGALVRSLNYHQLYYRQHAATWELQAMLRASHGAGDPAITEALLRSVDPLRYPADGLTRSQVSEIRKLKARMEVERMPRGSDPSRNTKLGPGGLSDVEWVVQLLQLRHAGALPELRTTATLPALQAATDADLIGESDAVILRDAWTLASRIRNGIMLLRGRASDSLPTDTRELGALAEVLGFTKGEASVLQETYLKATRQARAVMDRLFWED